MKPATLTKDTKETFTLTKDEVWALMEEADTDEYEYVTTQDCGMRKTESRQLLIINRKSDDKLFGLSFLSSYNDGHQLYEPCVFSPVKEVQVIEYRFV